MTHKLKVKLESGERKVEIDGQEVTSIKGIVMKSAGVNLECSFMHNSFGVTLTTDEGEMEFAIPDSLAEALK